MLMLMYQFLFLPIRILLEEPYLLSSNFVAGIPMHAP